MSTRADGRTQDRTPLTSRTLPALDTLRAVAALAVLTTHTAFNAGAYVGHGLWGTMSSRLDVGVAIFFALSGFLLSRPWLNAAARGMPGPAAGRYLWRRLVRIAPVYVLTVVLALTFIGSNEGTGILGWLRTMLMLDTFTSTRLPAGLSHMWSLAVEISFYVVLPALMMVVTGRRGRPGAALRPLRVVVLLSGMLLTSVLWQAWLAAEVEERTGGTTILWLPGYLAWFAAGIGVALVHQLHRDGSDSQAVRWFVDLGRQPGVCWAMAGALMLVSATPLAGPALLIPPSPSEALTKHLLYAAVAGLLVLTTVMTSSGTTHRVLVSRPGRHLGVISYSIFCLHMPVTYLVMWLTGWPLFDGRLAGIWILTLLVSLVAAELSYRLIEVPTARLRDLAWPRRRRDRSPPVDPGSGLAAEPEVDPLGGHDESATVASTGTSTR